MNIYGRILLRPERSSAARRCACLHIFPLLFLHCTYLLLHKKLDLSLLVCVHFAFEGKSGKEDETKVNNCLYRIQ